VLVERQGDLVSKDEIMVVVWPGRVVEDNNLIVQISTLRHILDHGRADGSCIQAVPRRGYRFTAAVTRRETDARSGDAMLPQTNARPPARLSIVVLPFTNLGNDPEQEYFADAITDDLTTDLSRIEGSFVIARSTAFTYKGKPVDVKQIGGELVVRYVVEGSVQRTGDQIRVNAQLTDAESGAHLWADRFETDPSSLAKAQDEITGRLTRTLHLELVKAAGRRIEGERAVDPDVRDLIMRGWAWTYRPYSIANRREALRNFERALEIDPGSVDARIGLAAGLVLNLANDWSSSIEQDVARAEHLLLDALERDPNSSSVRLWVGMLRRIQNRFSPRPQRGFAARPHAEVAGSARGQSRTSRKRSGSTHAIRI
jgi:TolB-like protein